MARQRAPVQVNQLIGGINTEANPLSFPEGFTVEEQNMVLMPDGSRKRRDGFDQEAFIIDDGAALPSGNDISRSTFLWENPGGFTDKSFLVVQIGPYVGVHDTAAGGSLSASQIAFKLFSVNDKQRFDFQTIDGTLVIASGEQVYTIFNYDGVAVTQNSGKIFVRDFFGVASVGANTSGVAATDVVIDNQFRPSTLSGTHLYNLRNQSFGLPRINGGADNTDLLDPVAAFYAESGNTRYPSNSDTVNRHLLANPNLGSNRTVERFDPESLWKTQPPISEAPKGFFIIDLLKRGTSRIAAEARLRGQHPTLSLTVSSLPSDESPKGPSVLGQFGGRIWFGGFTGEVTLGDRKSPKLSSYIAFSQLVESPTQIGKCFQESDPTSHTDSDLVDTDGGLIKLDGAYGINRMVTMGSSLLVFADNGVWVIQGGDQSGFRATNYVVTKLTEEGCVGHRSVIVAENAVMYWSDYDIYALGRSDTGDWSVQNITEDRIQTLYQNIPIGDKVTAEGVFEEDSNSIRWIYGNSFTVGSEKTELILNTKFNAFTQNKISGSTAHNYIIGVSRLEDSTVYVVLLDDNTVKYTFGYYQQGTVRDWRDINGGFDSPAYILTGPITGGTARLRKDIPYVTTFMMQTEDAVDGSGCLLSAQWDWTTKVSTGRWSTPRQVYRSARGGDGNEMIVSKNRIRGHGSAVSLRFESEPDKQLRLYGWEHNLDATTEE